MKGSAAHHNGIWFRGGRTNARTIHGTPVMVLPICDASGIAKPTICDRVVQQAARSIRGGHVACATGQVRQQWKHDTTHGHDDDPASTAVAIGPLASSADDASDLMC